MSNKKLFDFSAKELRRNVGILGFLMPFILLIGGVILEGEHRSSLSGNYHHDRLGDVFVATLSVIGFFLLAYKGYSSNGKFEKDNLAGNLGFIFALGTAFFPTNYDGVHQPEWFGVVHFICALFLFLVLIFFSLCLFTQTNTEKAPSKQKIIRNKIYRYSAYVMIACIVLIGLHLFFENHPFVNLKPVFWLESIAVWAFGFSWLVKGEAIFADK